MKVSSDKRRRQCYWVEENDKVVFKSNNASEALQWAIDNVCKKSVNELCSSVLEDVREAED